VHDGALDLVAQSIPVHCDRHLLNEWRTTTKKPQVIFLSKKKEDNHKSHVAQHTPTHLVDAHAAIFALEIDFTARERRVAVSSHPLTATENEINTLKLTN
jgi:hypothetical protein